MKKRAKIYKIDKAILIDAINRASTYTNLYKILECNGCNKKQLIEKMKIDNIDEALLQKFDKYIINNSPILSKNKEEMELLIQKFDDLKDLLKFIGCNSYNTATFYKKCQQDNIDVSKYHRKTKIINKKYGFLTVKSLSHTSKAKNRNNHYYNCLCDCGNTITLNGSDINKKQHCGCKINENIINTKINKLTCVEDYGTQHGKQMIRLLCDCGNYKNYLKGQFLSGRIQSCGCSYITKGKHRASYRGVGDLSGYLWSRITRCAKQRNITFTITKEQAWNKFLEQNKLCALSGIELVMCDSRTEGYTTASLDRIDNTQGYHLDNIRWVHKNINRLKLDYTDNDFIEMCTNVFASNYHKIKKVNRPDWHDYFLTLAFIVSERSIDYETKHGAVIVDNQNHIISTGYNSFLSGLPDYILPNMRPEKYNKMIHAECNAIYNAKFTYNTQHTLYVTGKPCVRCLQAIASVGITDIYMADNKGSKLEDDEKDDFNLIINLKKIKLNIIKPKMNFLYNIINRGINLGFIHNENL